MQQHRGDCWIAEHYRISLYYENSNTLQQLAVRSKILSKLIFFCKLCVIFRLRVHHWVCVLVKDIGRRLPLELQCSLYQGQQGDVSQSVRGSYKTRF